MTIQKQLKSISSPNLRNFAKKMVQTVAKFHAVDTTNRAQPPIRKCRVQASLPESRFDSNKILSSPPDVFFNACFDRNHLKSVIAWFLDHYGEKRTIDLVETFKQVGFHHATRAGVSLGVDDLQIPPQKAPLLSQASMKKEDVTNAIQTGNLTSVEKSQRLIDTWNQTSETLRQAAVHNFRITNPVNPVYMMAFSGARGNISQVRQLVAMRGLMADPQGAILEFPIQSNFREGLTVTEYMISCYGARKGLVDTALRTATSGYLTRRLVDAVQHVVIYVTNCHTKKGIVIKDTNVEQRIIGRVLLKDIILDSKVILKKNTLISPRIAKQIALKHKQVFIRSPLTCQTEKSVCQLCYGLDLAQGKLVSIGEAVGIIAAQSIGEPGTQLTMRTFHTGGVGVFSDQAMKSFTAPFDGKIEFLESLVGLFVRTPHGNIVYLLKHKTLDKTKPILRLISSHPARKSSVYEIQHGEVPSESLVWVKQGEFVKTGQLLVQASRLQKASQEMPESIHPVRAPFSAEIFLESMRYETIDTKTKKKKEEIYPIIPTLKELGNFWVFSTSIQKESQVSRRFFKKGDLFSPETPIQQYNLEIAWKAQLKQLDSSLIFGHNVVNFLFAKIHYSGSFYFFLESGEKTSTSYHLLTYTTNLNSTRLIWYPFFKNLLFRSSLEYKFGMFPKFEPFEIKSVRLNNLLFAEGKGYWSLFDFESDFLSPKNFVDLQNPAFPQNQSDKTDSGRLIFSIDEKGEAPNFERGDLSKTGVIPKSEIVNSNHTNCVCSPHLLFHLKLLKSFENKKFLPLSCLLMCKEDQILSKTGLFQIASGQEIQWSRKSSLQTSFRKNTTIGLNERTILSSFVEKGLKTGQKVLDFEPGAPIIEKKQSWISIPEKEIRDLLPSQLPGVILEPGKQFENLSFPNSYVSANLLCRKTFFLLKSKTKMQRSAFWYSLEELVSSTKQFPTDLKQSFLLLTFSQSKILGGKNGIYSQKLRIFGVGDEKPINNNSDKTWFARRESILFSFYKKQTKNENIICDSVSDLAQKRNSSREEEIRNFYQELHNIGNKIKTKRRLSHLVLFQKNYQKVLPNREFLKKNWLLQKKLPSRIWFNSPLFTKQYKTDFQHVETLHPRFTIVTPSYSKWGGFQSILKVELEFNTLKTFRKHENLKQQICIPKNKISEENCKAAIPGFSLMFYRRIQFDNARLFDFRTFDDGWVVPRFTITQAFLKANKLGEFRRLQMKRDAVFLSILRDQDLVNLQVSDQTTQIQAFRFQVGRRIRWGQELFENFATPVSGQIIKLTRNTLTIRTGLPLLASIRGLVHITDNDLVEKNDLLITLRSKRLQTEDIVQGIPKIEQLFEARETQGGQILKNNIHRRLKLMFSSALQRKPFSQAVESSLLGIQKFLVESILEAYSNQGVHIAEKHVEVVVRQMTARVRILRGGNTGFLPGELVQHRMIQRINLQMVRLGRRPASYEPVVLGITKSVLQSESFLLAVGFQQVSQVLVRSALSKKTDFLRGLHENIMVGQPMPAGTALVPLKEFKNSSLPPVTETVAISAEISRTENPLEVREDFVDIIAQSSERGAPQVPSLSESGKKTSKSRNQKAVDSSAETETKKRKSQKNKRLEEGNEPGVKKTKPSRSRSGPGPKN